MSPSIIIARKELQTFFDSLVAYILLVAFLGFSGFFTWLYGSSDVFFAKQASLQPFFGTAYWTLFFFIPALTMRMLAEENKTGTIELLLTKPISNWQVLWGKFLACFMLIFFALLCTLPYYITIINLGKVDSGVILCGYLGLLMISSAYIAIGIFASSITNNQIVAFLVALFIGIFFQVLFGMLASNMPGTLGETLNYLSLSAHYDAVSRGVVDSRDLIYFGSIVFLSLTLAETSLSKRSVSE
jgi:ABC-2 type transport system permease protein